LSENEYSPTLETLLQGMDRAQLLALVRHLMEQQPNLVSLIRQQMILSQPFALNKIVNDFQSLSQTHSTTMRRQVRDCLRSGEPLQKLRSLLEKLPVFLEAGEGGQALALLEVITDEYIQDQENCDEDEYEGYDFYENDERIINFLEELDQAWAETILNIQLTVEQRQHWDRCFHGWEDDLDHSIIEYFFSAAPAALKYGWDDPALQQVLQGKNEELPWEDENGKDSLVKVYLRLLENQQRYQEYLLLAKAARHDLTYILMLIELNDIPRAVTACLEKLTDSIDILKVAQILGEKQAYTEALKITRYGLTLEDYNTSQLAEWTCNFAEKVGQNDDALQAGILACQKKPNLSMYLKVKNLAGVRWPTVREQLLVQLRVIKHHYYDYENIAIFLHEGLIEEAISALPNYAGESIIKRVIEAALPTHADWVISIAQRRIEAILKSGKPSNYNEMINWLEKLKSVYMFKQQHQEWQNYLIELREQHKRKPRLVELLDKFKTNSIL